MPAGSDVSNSRCVPAGSEVSNSRCAKIASGASWVCFWLVLGAHEGLLRLVLASSGGILGTVWGYILIQKKRRDSSWDSLGFVCSLLAADDGLKSSQKEPDRAPKLS